MALKGHPDAAPVPPTSRSRPWGVLAEEGDGAQVVRFVVGDKSVSIPFHTFKRWEYSPGTAETITIRTDSEIITIAGRGLADVRDALDAGELLILRVKSGRAPTAPSDETTITGITFAVASE